MKLDGQRIVIDGFDIPRPKGLVDSERAANRPFDQLFALRIQSGFDTNKHLVCLQFFPVDTCVVSFVVYFVPFVPFVYPGSFRAAATAGPCRW